MPSSVLDRFVMPSGGKPKKKGALDAAGRESYELTNIFGSWKVYRLMKVAGKSSRKKT